MKAALYWAWEALVSESAYRILLPLAARLPFSWGAKIAALRGACDARHDRDWRSLSLHHHYVKETTRGALAQISPHASAQVLQQALRERFVMASVEEWQAHLIMAGRASQVGMYWEGMTHTQLQASENKGTVWMTAHFDSVMLGIVHLGLAGLKFNLMTSTVVEDERSPASIRAYYRKKYAAMARYFNGGRALQAERYLKTLYAGLQQGESVVILADAPALSKEEGLLVNFLGAPRYLAPGALRMAQYANAPMGAFVCLQERPGHYRLVIHPPIIPGPEGYGAAAQQLYDFLSRKILAQPGRWWAADLLPTMIKGR